MILLQLLWILFGGAVAYSVLLYALLARQLYAYAPPAYANKDSSSATEGVTVVVCARNEHHNLAELLPLLFQQQHPNFEVVVADDASTDGTRAFLRAQQQTHPQLTIVPIDRRVLDMQPKKHALQRAIRAARHDRLLLTDADCRPASAHWLSLMSQPLSGRTQVVLGYSPYFRQAGWLNRFIGYETLHTGLLYTGSALGGHPYMGVGRNLAYRKLFFEEGEGFRRHRTVVGGDDDLWVNEHANRVNTRVVLAREALVYSVPETNWKRYYHQKIRHLHASQHYARWDQWWLGMLSLSTVLVWLAGILLLTLSSNWQVIAGLFLLRWLILAAALRTAGRRLHDPIKLALLPILDLLHVIYYIAIGTRAFATTNISWKN